MLFCRICVVEWVKIDEFVSLIIITIFFVGGVCLLQTRESLPDLMTATVLLLPLAALWFRKTRWLSLAILCFGGGFYYAGWRGELRLAQQLPAALQWQDIVVEGVVRGFPRVFPKKTTFDFEITRLVSPAMSLPLRVRLSDYHYNMPSLAAIRHGAKLRLKIRIRPPHENANPGGFDYAGFLFARGVRANGYVRSRDEVVILDGGGGWRDSLRRRAATIVPHGELLAALLVGDRSGIEPMQWEILRRTGTAHLLSISGTHITLAAAFAAFAVLFLWRRSRRLMRYMPAQKAALIVAIPAALGYAFLSGFGVPAQRSVLMFMIAAVALLGGGRVSAIQTIFMAAALVVLADPWAILSAGFWLSFMLAGAVLAVVDAENRRFFYLIKLQLLISIFAIPLTLWFFNEASLVSPLANMVAVPLVGVIILPLIFMDIFLPGDWLWYLAGEVLGGLWYFLGWLSSLSFASWQAATVWWLLVPACLGGAWMLMPRGVPLRWLGALPVLAMLLWQPSPPDDGDFYLTVLDVGQGDAVVVETRSHMMIYDAGPPYAARIIDRFLRRRGRRRVDLLMISHDDNDHRGGAAQLLQVRSVAAVSAPFVMSPPRAKYSACVAGDEWEWDGVHFLVLHPPLSVAGLSDNASSCVIKISARGGSVILTGDIPSEIEQEMAARLSAETLHADLLLAAHHGSRYSSSEEFLRAVSPRAVIFSAGRGNVFGHPHPLSLLRAMDVGALVYRTDIDGAIGAEFRSDGMKIIRWRDYGRRYWHRQK